MNIQRFTSIDETINQFSGWIDETKNEINALAGQKQSEIDEYNKNYNNQLTQYDALLNQQKDLIDTETEKQKEIQQKQTDYNIGLINQNKEKAEKQTQKETGDAYTDYLKSINQYGGNAEALAASGLINQGIQETSRIAMNITYQNRVSSAKSALLQANTEYDNQIQQALLTNDANLAELALNSMKQKYQIALQGFEYKNNMYNTKMSYMQHLDDTYFDRQQTLQSRIDNYNQHISNLRTAKEEIEEKRRQFEAEMAENRRQFDMEFAENQRQFDAQMAANERYYDYSSSNSNYSSDYGYSDNPSSQSSNSNIFGNSEKTMSKKDYYFSNGYQPRYINNTKLSDTGINVGQIYGGQLGENRRSQNIWYASGKYYIWLGNGNGGGEYMQVDAQDVSKIKNASSTWNSIWHKGV